MHGPPGPAGPPGPLGSPGPRGAAGPQGKHTNYRVNNRQEQTICLCLFRTDWSIKRACAYCCFCCLSSKNVVSRIQSIRNNRL